MSRASIITDIALTTSTSHAAALETLLPSTSPVPTRSARPSVLRVAPWLRRDPWRGRTLIAIRVVHSLVFFGEELSVGYLLYAGVRKRQDRAAAAAAAAIAAESLIYFGNGQHCPLSGLAEDLGADHISVTDIYLPRWIAMRIFTYNAPLVVLAAVLHARVFLARRLRADGAERVSRGKVSGHRPRRSFI
jgi:hypothetical protein